jgi:hypothetical protein
VIQCIDHLIENHLVLIRGFQRICFGVSGILRMFNSSVIEPDPLKFFTDEPTQTRLAAMFAYR